MPFSRLDAGAIGRSLAQVADRDTDLGEAYFERREVVELPSDGDGPGLRLRREEGFAVRLVRDGVTWMASRDGLEPALFGGALRQVARAVPRAPYPDPPLAVEPPPPCEAPEVLELPSELSRRLRDRRVAFPLRLTVRRHLRQLQIVGTRLVPDAQQERYYSLEAVLPWGRFGALLPTLDADALDDTAARLMSWFHAREAPPPPAGRPPLVLAPAAAAVLLHEAVAHALETDTLILGGRPEAAPGVQLAAPCLSVLDDPASAPAGVERQTDDEGLPVVRRWLLREGVVLQPLADLFAARQSSELAPGAARREDRHAPPVPRSHHLELLAGGHSLDALLSGAEGGLWVPEASRGALDPASGRFVLELPHARRIHGGEADEVVGPFRLRGRVSEVLRAVDAVGAVPRVAGAGWCAKGGQRLPVWATAPALRLEGLEVWP